MKTISKLASGLALAAISSAAMAGGIGIAQTKHNLGSGNLTGGNYTNATTEICVFCHTPHGADQSASAPLWNRTLSNTSVYTRYSALGTSSFDAAEAPIGSVSIACLSCHDGTQAMDAVLNSPGGGSGFTDSNTSALGLDNDSTGLGGGDAIGGVTGGFASTTNQPYQYGGWHETSTMSMMAAADNGDTGDLIYIGTDLRNDHPVSMQYGGGGITELIATLARDTDYPDVTNTVGDWGTNTAKGGTGKVNQKTLPSTLVTWYVDTGGEGQQKSDLPLYSRTLNSANQPFVECATCHDPHSNNGVFLRAPFVSAVSSGVGTGGGNGGSQICLTCHAK